MNYNFEIGDIILVSSTNQSLKVYSRIIPYVNYTSQQIGTFKFKKNYNYTHVILSLSKELFIDSTPENGIEVYCLGDLINNFSKLYNSNFKVIRNKNVKLNILLKEKLFKAAEYYYGQSYNWQMLSKKEYLHKSYCSDFISNVYNRINIKIKDEKPIWPIHIYELIENNNWEDITEEYEKYFNDYKKTKELSKDNNLLNIFRISDLFKRFHKNKVLINTINEFTNRYDTSNKSFYNELYPNEDIKIQNNDDILLEDKYTPINFKEMESIFGNLKTFASTIKFYIEEDNSNNLLKNEDVQINWNIHTNVESIQKITNDRIIELYNTLNLLDELNVYYKKNIQNIVEHYPLFNIKKEENIKNFIKEFQKLFPIPDNLKDMENEIISIMNEYNTLISKVSNQKLFEIIKLHSHILIEYADSINLHIKLSEYTNSNLLIID